MKYHVDHACGHTVEHVLFGPTSERKRKLEWMATQPCLDCKEAKDQQRLTSEAQEAGLPQLEGTPKQIAWANQIRGAVWQQCQNASLDSLHDWAEFLEWLFSHTSAHWWIDNRTTSLDMPANIAGRLNWFFTGRVEIDWRAYYTVWCHRNQHAAEDELKRQRIAWEKKVLDTFFAEETVAVWTSPRNPDDRRIYRDGELIFDPKGAGKAWTDDDVALMRQLCHDYRSLKIKRRKADHGRLPTAERES